ncbi:unnamed protein product [Cylindrotheca closterium]|uniref:Uncharacterized protein n=1 Tax=Cylindrotheca closterium TaxID=2856 RepID=A0AAD2GDJ0_9STRA|nr:unnamed protein product [Cylindrotheca closterium]
MTITDFTVRKKSYRYLTTQASYPNHDSKAVLDAFDPTKDLQLQDLNSLVEKGVQGGAPAWYTGWPKEQVNNFNFWHRPMIRYTTVGEKKEQHFDKLYVLDHDVLENGSDPLAFSWPAKAFSKTDPVKVPKLEAWLINEALEQDHSKLFVMEDITDEDPEMAYDLLVTRKRMPIPKEFLDIAWDGSSAREVLQLVIDRIKILANSEEPEKILEVHEKFRHFVNHWRVANTVIGRDQLSKNVGEPAVLTATSARRWVSGVINSDFAGLDSEDSIGNSPDKTYELLTKTLAAVEESNKTTKTSVESLSEVVVAGIHGQASDKVPPNTVEKKWPTRLSYLKRVAGTTTSVQLPILWHELAKCKKHESIGIVQSLLDDEAEKLNLNLEFIVSARVIKSLVELEFCSRGDVEKGLNVFNSVCFQHYKNANAINDYNKSDYWLTGEKTTASMKDHQAHDKIKHAIFPRDPMQFREMVNSMRVFYLVVFGKTHPLTAVYEKFAKNVDLIARKMGVSQQERALERFLFGIYSRIDHRYFEHLVRSGTNAEENLPDLGTYMETCYHGGSLPESSLFVVAKDPVGPGGTGDKTESQLKREKERAQGHPEKICRFQPKHPLPQEDMYFPWRSACRREQA